VEEGQAGRDLHLEGRLERHHRQVLAGGPGARAVRDITARFAWSRPTASTSTSRLRGLDQGAGSRPDHLTQTTRLFAGAKTVPLLASTSTAASRSSGGSSGTVPGQRAPLRQGRRLGHVPVFTRPIFNILEIFYKLVGNFGVAIMLLTVALKLVLFPLADKSYESMAKMKKIAPEVEKLKAKHKDDPAKQQQEMMALYGKEKINPMMGCLPMLIQIPVFYSLYKVLTVTIEMRHAPFFGWIQDLSARDPSTFMNLFGLIPWDPATAPLIGAFLSGPLHIGVWPLLYGFTMWLTTAMNPPAADPIQQKIFQFFPIIFTFTLSQFSVGLVIYWCWSNMLTILQQYIIMHRYKVENPIDKIIARFQRQERRGHLMTRRTSRRRLIPSSPTRSRRRVLFAQPVPS
jgi:YidC/Oxa1 family membrane protein insertase